MAITAPPPHAPHDPPGPSVGRDRRDDGAPPRRLGRRRNLPGSRAVVGGLLVTLAAIGTFVASTSANAGPTATVVVATRPIAIGERLVAADLRAVPADLPDDVLATLFDSTGALEGAVALAPVAADQAIARAGVRSPTATDLAGTHDLSFALDRDRALNGRIRPGELVDLVATVGTGTDATTEIVVRRVRVVDVDAPVGSTGAASARVTVTLAFDSEDDVLLAANALEVAKVTISRSTDGAADPPAPDPRDVDSSGDRSTGSTTTATPSTAPATVAPADDEAQP